MELISEENRLEGRIAMSSSLSMEQSALLSHWGGEKSLPLAINILCFDVKPEIPEEQLCSLVDDVLQCHSVLSADICREHGFLGLRMPAGGHNKSTKWRIVDEKSPNQPELFLPVIDREEYVLATLVKKKDGSAKLILAVSALFADRGSMIEIAKQIVGTVQNEEREEFFQYSQYIQWCQELEHDEGAVLGKEYWDNYLHDCHQLHAPYLIYRGKGLHSPLNKFWCVYQPLSTTDIEGVRQFAILSELSVETLLQTAWWALLSSLTGCNQYIAGWQHDCRQDYDVMQGAVGVFEKVLPLIIKGSTQDTFSEWLVRMATCTEAHIDAQEYCPINNMASTEHLSVGFVYQDGLSHGREAMESRDWLSSREKLRLMELPGPMPCFELALSINMMIGGSIEISVYADTSLYQQEDIECLLKQYMMFVRGALQKPNAPISTLPLLSESDQQRMMEYGRGQVIDIGPLNLSQHISHWASVTPDAPALKQNNQQLNYAELEVYSNRLAHWMLELGVVKGDLVALNLPRSIDLIIAMLATWKIGAAYLPLEPDWPSERKKLVLSDANPVMILSDTKSIESDVRILVSMDEIHPEKYPIDLPVYEHQQNDLAYVLYTSGSTGQPKGVMIEQRQLLNYIVAATSEMNLEKSRCWGVVNSIAADLGNTALFGALYNGTCLAIANDTESRDAKAFGNFITKNSIDSLKIVPSHLEALLESDMCSLPQMLVLGGESPSPSLLERIQLLAPDSVIYNHYGPTETTVGVMVHAVGSVTMEADTLQLSNVLANNCVYVLDSNRLPVPVGGQGELYVAGAQVCRGYLNRDTESDFVFAPWQPSLRLYPTGDLAWVLSEGRLRLAGRTDHQVKIRGYRVDPADVESVMLALPDVQNTVVIARETGQGQDVDLIAFIESNVFNTSDTSVFRKHVIQYLPEHMHPSHYVVLTEFPRLHNGKVDRRVLDVMEFPNMVENPGKEPSNPLEAVLSRYMADLLKRESISVDTDFFEVGGHSLLVIRLVARIRKLFQIEIEPSLVFDHSTPQDLATQLYAIGSSDQLNQIAKDA